MALPLGQTHHIQRKLVGLEAQVSRRRAGLIARQMAICCGSSRPNRRLNASMASFLSSRFCIGWSVMSQMSGAFAVSTTAYFRHAILSGSDTCVYDAQVQVRISEIPALQ